MRSIATADKARYNIHDYAVELKRVVVNLYIKRATIFTPAQKEQLLDYAKKTSYNKLTKALAVEDLTKLWRISTTSSTALRMTTPKDGSDQNASTPKRSNKKSDRSVLAQNVSPVILLKKDVNDATQTKGLTDGVTHTNSDEPTIKKVLPFMEKTTQQSKFSIFFPNTWLFRYYIANRY